MVELVCSASIMILLQKSATFSSLGALVETRTGSSVKENASPLVEVIKDKRIKKIMRECISYFFAD